MAVSHKHVPLFGATDRGGGFGDVREVRQSRDMVQQARCLCVGGIAVGVAILLLDVPPQFPALPLLQDLRLHFFVDKAVQDGHQETLEGGEEEIDEELSETQTDGGLSGLVCYKDKDHLMDTQQRDQG